MQAILVLAHKDVNQVIELCSKLCPYFNVYVHFDKKASISEKQFKSLRKLGINYYSVYDVKWGSYNIVLATLFLVKEALKNEKNEYFHLISGQDWPVKSPEYIYNYFKHDERIYMNYFRADSTEKSNESLIWWTKFYFNYNKINRRSLFGKIYHRLLVITQRLFKVDKLKKYGINKNEIYAGEEWFDIPREPLQYAVNEFDTDKSLQKVFSTSFCSDEMWLQTILCNSPFKDKIDKNIHRYISWIRKNDSYPAILDLDDFNSINNSDCLFGRKFAYPYSESLMQKLNNTFIEENQK